MELTEIQFDEMDASAALTVNRVDEAGQTNLLASACYSGIYMQAQMKNRAENHVGSKKIVFD